MKCDGGKVYTRERELFNFSRRKMLSSALSVSWNFSIEIDRIVNLAIVNTHCTLLRRTRAESGLIFAEWRGRSGWNTSFMTCLHSTTIRDMNHARQACDVWIRAKYFEDSSARFRVSRNPFPSRIIRKESGYLNEFAKFSCLNCPLVYPNSYTHIVTVVWEKFLKATCFDCR